MQVYARIVFYGLSRFSECIYFARSARRALASGESAFARIYRARALIVYEQFSSN